MTAPLAAGATMPPIHAKDLDGNAIDITASLAGRWAIVILYRGHW